MEKAEFQNMSVTSLKCKYLHGTVSGLHYMELSRADTEAFCSSDDQYVFCEAH